MIPCDKTAGPSTNFLPTSIHSHIYEFVTAKNKSTCAKNFCDYSLYYLRTESVGQIRGSQDNGGDMIKQSAQNCQVK